MIDLDNLAFAFHRWTSRIYNGIKVNLKRDRAKITFVGKMSYLIMNEYGEYGFIPAINHEFMHWILWNFVSHKAGDTYDDYLDACGLYYHEAMAKEML